ncbi:MAG: HlyD family secretion protein [Bacteroidales bacterium]|nr:HlyD family secretion protein [Bacteroidales bacterium]
MRKAIYITLILTLLTACKNEPTLFDASGLFNPTEITVSADSSGIISSISAQSGELIAIDMPICAIDDNIIVSPITGVLTYLSVSEGDTVAIGDPLGILGDMNNMELITYVRESIVDELTIGQNVQVFIEPSLSQYKKYEGTITDISIMSSNNVVENREPIYKLMIAVTNDGAIKIGMFGHLRFNEKKK